jgi:hypothetical protein
MSDQSFNWKALAILLLLIVVVETSWILIPGLPDFFPPENGRIIDIVPTPDISGQRFQANEKPAGELKIVYDPYKQCCMMAEYKKALDNFSVNATAADYGVWLEGAVDMRNYKVPTVYRWCGMFEPRGIFWRKATKNFNLPEINLYIGEGIPQVNIIVPKGVKFLGKKESIVNARLYFMEDYTTAGVGAVSAYKEQWEMLEEIQNTNCTVVCPECGCKPGTHKETYGTISGRTPAVL